MKLLGQMQAGVEGDGPEAQLHMAAGVWGIAGFEQALGSYPDAGQGTCCSHCRL